MLLSSTNNNITLVTLPWDRDTRTFYVDDLETAILVLMEFDGDKLEAIKYLNKANFRFKADNPAGRYGTSVFELVIGAAKYAEMTGQKTW